MLDLRRPLRLPGVLRPVAGFAIGAAGAAVLSIATSQGYLHATVVTGGGYTGSTAPLDPAGQLLMLFLWLLTGGIAGYIGRSGWAFVGLWLGALAGSTIGFLADPDGNILWLDVIVTIVGVSLFVTPGFFLGSAIAGRVEGLEPDGSGARPTPPPLWLRGRRTDDGPTDDGGGRPAVAADASGAAGPTLDALRGSPAAPNGGRVRGASTASGAASYPASAYARPAAERPE